MKKLILLLLVAAMLLSLAACGGSGSTNADNTADDAAEEATVEDAADDAADAADEADEADEAAASTGDIDLGDTPVFLAVTADVVNMDVAQTTAEYYVPMNVYDRLFEIKVQDDGSTDIVPSLVADYSVSDDGLTYSFTIRDDVFFTNGVQMTANDVKYTFVRLLTAGGVNTEIPEEVVGAEALENGEADDLEGIEVIDDYNLTVTLSAPNAGFIAELTSPAMSIVCQSVVENAENIGLNIDEVVGSGPYMIVEWVPNDHHTLVRNDNYWGEKPSASAAVRYVVPDASTQNLMFQNGELDIIDLDNLDAAIISSTYKTTYADSIVAGHRVGVTYMAMNENNEFLSDVNVRKAVQMAINRQAILDVLYDGDGIIENGIIATGVWGHNPDLPEIEYNPDEARQLLTDAGYAENEVTFELALDNSAGATFEMLYQQVQQDLAAIGIKTNIERYDESAWLEMRKSGEMDSFFATWTMDYNDPANIMDVFYGSADNTAGRSLNYPDTEIMARVRAASSIVDDDERMAEYQALEEKIIVEDAAWVPMYERAHLFAIGENVAAFVPHWAGYGDFFVRDVTMN